MIEAGGVDGAGARLRFRGSRLLVLLACGAMYAVRAGAPVLVPILVSLLASYALEPFVAILSRRARLPRVLAVALVYAIVAAVALRAGHTLASDASAFVQSLPENVQALHDALQRPGSPKLDTAQPIRNIQAAVSEVQRAMPAPPRSGVRRVVEVAKPFDLQTYLLDVAEGAAGTGAQFLAVVMMTFALLVGGSHFKRKIVSLAGPEWSEKRLTVEVIHSIDRQIERYLIVRLLISAIVAAATGAVLLAVGLSHPLAWGVVAGVLNVMPFIGPAAAVALIALAAFIQFHSAGLTAAAVAGATLVAAAEGNILTPWLTGRAGELNTVAVFVGVLFWGWMWDVWGLVLAVPILVAVKAAADRIEPLQPIGELLGR